MNFKEFPERLRTMRQSRGWTQQELGKLVHLKASTIGMYERGEREPSFKVLEALADTFNVPLDSLCSSEGIDADLWDLRESLRRNPELRVLFDASKNATAEDLLEAADLIKARKTIRNITERK